jgi:bifunctional DNA-binding transcriptional regulator/antitoxin component of YhaV-PrlF toxin-antitoxin module
LQQDEERDIVRIGSSTRQYLGIDIQDKVKISWKEKQVVAQCLPPTADNDSSNQSLSPAEISIPSTLRDKIGVNPNDTIEVRRDSKYMFKEQIGLSILGILGVVFGTFQVLNSTEWIPVFVSLLGRIQATLLIFGIAGILFFNTLFTFSACS